jgi:uncharacterized OB-fold protein
MREQRPLPQPTKDTQPYWDGARAGKLLVQRCGGCGRYQFYPRPFCVKCLSTEITWVESAGRGRIYTYTVNHRPANPAMKDRVPYAVVAVDLEEGVRMLGNLVDSDLAKIAIGAAVSVVFEKISDEISLPQFRLVS